MDENNSQLCVLITGATGFIGSALAAYFYTQGMHVRALTRDLMHPFVRQNPQYEWVCADLLDHDSLISICDGIDFVFHLAGFAHASKNQDPAFQKKHHDLNYHSTVTLAKIAASVNVKRFIFFSTVKACADSSGYIDESWQAYPTDAYGIAKRSAEEILLTISAETKMDIVILRLSLVYGVSWKGNLAVMLKAIDKNWFPPIPAINNQKSMVSLHDVCLAAKCAAFAELKSNRIFIVTDGHYYSTRAIYELMRKALGKRQSQWAMPLRIWRFLGKFGDLFQKIIHRELPINSEAVEKLFGSAKYRSLYAENEIGFIPQFTFESTLPEIVAGYRSYLP